MAREIAAPTRVLPRYEEKQVKVVGLYRMILMRFIRHRLAVIGLGVETALLFFTFVGPFLVPYSPDQVNLRERFAPPSFAMLTPVTGQPHVYNMAAVSAASDERPLRFGHPLGTDDLGRDTMTRAMFGGRVSLGIGFIVAIFATIMSAVIGSVSGYAGGWWDNLIQRANDVSHSLPDLPILMILSKMFPPGFWTMCLILLAMGGIRGGRVTRSMVLRLKQEQFTEAAKASGAAWPRLIFRHFIPNALSPLTVSMTLSVGNAIRTETSLSYLGLGIQPPMPSWGNMLSNAQQYFFSAPWLVFYPGIFIFLTLFCFNMIGDGLRDAFDPRMTQR
ncbi:MAG: ABC transporter permease [Chloroflexi bacterium]|nr:ABC transporter permease [Chloroflexota bacterium]